jgi:hypothetical protein
MFGTRRLTDPLCNRITVVCLQISIGKPRPHCRAIRIGADDLNLLILFLEIAAHTSKGAAGTDGCDKRAHLALGLFPDFRTCAAIMRVAISRVIELVRPEPTALLCEATRDMIVIFGGLMNDAVYKFKRYEDASLSYTGINKHSGEEVGLYDTVLSPKDYRLELANVPRS